ncbi:MAG: UvrD-helicase domain-containing protein [Nitrospiraceae bacterium]|nr:UvrD-helicase domain-containing protein [Nitrospiraceae bacterium]
MSKNILSELNQEQREAINHAEGPLLILAGAGSGKTRVISCRFAHLARNFSPAQIFAVTFTNKAAFEMKERICALLGKDFRQCWIGTFHSQCVKILRREIGQLGWSPDFSIYDDGDQLALIRHILKELNLYEALYRGVLSKISYLKSCLIKPEEFLSRSDGFGFEERLAKVYMRYQDELKKSNSLDFDDLITFVIRLFEEYPAVHKKYQNLFEHVLVDEFQDTNAAQYRLLKLMVGSRGNIFAVGDDDQSIYRFRGADVGNMMSFQTDFPGARVIKLERSYRCTQNILDVSGSVISKNLKRHPKKLWTDRGAGEAVSFFWLDSEEDEARHIVKTIREIYLKNSYDYGNFAVLYRVNTQSRALEDHLQSEGVPYKVLGGISFYQRKEIRDITAYMKLVLNRDDNVSLRRVINCPQRGIGASTMTRVEQHSKKKAISLYASIKALLRTTTLSSTMKDKLEGFANIIEKISGGAHKDAAELIKDILETVSYTEGLDEDRVQNIGEFISSAAGKDPKEFADRLSLASNTDDSAQEGHVSLLTLHGAKGLEFPVVFLAGLEEGLLPYLKAQTPEELAEERRLLYVGMTRAKDMLILTGAKSRRMFEKIKEQRPSRFLQDIPRELCVMVEKTFRNAVKKEELKPKPIPSPYVSGTRVKHPKWGVGIVRDCYGEGEEAKVTVNFPMVGVKKLCVKFANLETLHG